METFIIIASIVFGSPLIFLFVLLCLYKYYDKHPKHIDVDEVKFKDVDKTKTHNFLI